MKPEVKDDKTVVLAFRVPETVSEELLSKAEPDETKSRLLRRVVDTFLEKKPEN
jgi:hypothetical protein